MANEIEKPIYDICNNDISYLGETSKRLAINLHNNYGTSMLIYEGQEAFCIPRPDILLIDDKFIYGIEHFEFDDYKRNGGSTGRAFLSKKEKDFKKNFSKINFENNDSNFSYYKESYDMSKEESLKVGYNYFVDNFLYGFNQHYEKIEDYKKNIEKYLLKNKLQREIKIYFLIENSSPLMPFCDGSDEYNGLMYVPFYSKEIQEKIKNSDNLDGIISLNKNNKPLTIIYSKQDGQIDELCNIINNKYYHSASKPHGSNTIFSIPNK